MAMIDHTWPRTQGQMEWVDRRVKESNFFADLRSHNFYRILLGDPEISATEFIEIRKQNGEWVPGPEGFIIPPEHL